MAAAILAVLSETDAEVKITIKASTVDEEDYECMGPQRAGSITCGFAGAA